MKDKVIIIGAGGLGLCVANILCKQYEIAGFFDDNPPANYPYPVLGEINNLPEIGIPKGIIALGDNYRRKEVLEKILTAFPVFEQINAIHPSVILADEVSLGKGIVMDAGTIVGTHSRIGDNVLLLSGSIVEHENVLEDFVSLAPGSITGGKVRIGTFSAIGLGAKIIHNVSIGEHSVIGAGSLVLNNIGSFQVAYGSPAKEIRTRKEGEKYL